MIDINIVRDQPQILKESLEKRQMDISVIDKLAKLDKEWRAILTETEVLKAERNKVSKEIGKIKDEIQKKKKIAAMSEVGKKIASLDKKVKDKEDALNNLIATIPNILDEAVPLGKDESENKVLRQEGEIPTFDFKPLPHWELGTDLDIINFDQGAKVTGSRFYVP